MLEPGVAGLPKGSFLELVSSYRLWKLGELERAALFGLSSGSCFAVKAEGILAADAVVKLQAHGVRCVALIPERSPTLSGLALTLHDLRHLARFFDPVHHDGQVGFFRVVVRMMADGRRREVESALDEGWKKARDAVLADMNGSSVYLWVALRSRLLASLCLLEPFSAQKSLELFERWLDLFDFPADVREAARRVSTVEGRPDDAISLLSFFVKMGRTPPPSLHGLFDPRKKEDG